LKNPLTIGRRPRFVQGAGMLQKVVIASCLMLATTIAAPHQGSVPAARTQFDAVEQELSELTNAPGAPGFEEPVARIMIERLKPLVNKVERDGWGGVIGIKTGTAASPRVMLDTHLDETGLIVKFITPEGYVKFDPLGGWLDQVLMGSRWILYDPESGLRIPGTIGAKSPHLVIFPKPGYSPPMVPMDDMFIDVGAQSEKQAREAFGIYPGMPIVPDSTFIVTNNPKMYMAKAFDDRVGCAVMLEVLKRLQNVPHPNTVYAAGTVQEELGMRGAQVAVQAVQPDVGIAFEPGAAGDYPSAKPEESQEILGRGASMNVLDSSYLPGNRILAMVKQTAKAKGIPLQSNLLMGYGQDAMEIQRWSRGVPAILLTVPTRYLHSHNGIIHRDDFDAVVTLTVELVRTLDAATVKRLAYLE
jgi:putative aminopeptidase FrvX